MRQQADINREAAHIARRLLNAWREEDRGASEAMTGWWRTWFESEFKELEEILAMRGQA